LVVVGDAATPVRVPKDRDADRKGVDLPKAKSMMLLGAKPLTESENVHASSAQFVNARREILLWQCLSIVSRSKAAARSRMSRRRD
jgi:hypothetical protein